MCQTVYQTERFKHGTCQHADLYRASQLAVNDLVSKAGGYGEDAHAASVVDGFDKTTILNLKKEQFLVDNMDYKKYDSNESDLGAVWNFNFDSFPTLFMDNDELSKVAIYSDSYSINNFNNSNKKVYFKNDNLILVASNLKYDDRYFDQEEIERQNIQIIGKVLFVRRDFFNVTK